MATSSFTDSPTKRGKCRIVHDVKSIDVDSERLGNQEGLFFHFNMDTVFSTKYSMLIIGPDDSPYNGGFYLFDAQFPDQYPFMPMKMTSITQGGDIRKHPNLYVCGKCCFSFLGTWSGPPWTACQNPISVGLSMRSVLTNNPLQNEPGFEIQKTQKERDVSELYELIIVYFNIKYAVVGVVRNIRKNYIHFKDHINRIFVENYLIYKAQLMKCAKYAGQTIKSPVWKFSVHFDYNELNNELDSLYCSLGGTIEHSAASASIPSAPSMPPGLKQKKKYARKSPKETAANFETGTIMVGLDGRQWIVKYYPNLDKKRWVISH